MDRTDCRTEKVGVAKLVVAFAAIQILDGLCFPITRYGTQIIEPFTFSFYRFVISSIVLLLIVRARGRQNPIEKRDWWRIILLAVLIIPINQMLFMVGQSKTAAGHGAIIFGTSPVWIFILAIIHLKEKVRLFRVIGIVIAFSGVLLIMFGEGVEFRAADLFGDFLVLLAVIAWAYYTVIGKPLVVKYGAFRVTAYAIAIGSLLYFPFGAYRAWTFDYSQATLAGWGAIVYMAIGLSVILYVLWYWVLKYMEASRLAVWGNLYPVIAVVIAHLFLSEPLTSSFVVGGVAVLVGVSVAEVRSNKPIK